MYKPHSTSVSFVGSEFKDVLAKVTGDLARNFGAQALTDSELDKNAEIIKSLKDGAFNNLTGVNCSTDGQGGKINISYIYS